MTVTSWIRVNNTKKSINFHGETCFDNSLSAWEQSLLGQTSVIISVSLLGLFGRGTTTVSTKIPHLHANFNNDVLGHKPVID